VDTLYAFGTERLDIRRPPLIPDLEATITSVWGITLHSECLAGGPGSFKKVAMRGDERISPRYVSRKYRDTEKLEDRRDVSFAPGEVFCVTPCREIGEPKQRQN
jgi:hypothetical protein